MNPVQKFVAALFALGTLTTTPGMADNSRDRLTQLDGYGYFASSDASVCAYNPVDIETAGTSLSPTASTNGVAALDDGAAAVALTQPFRFYATAYSSVVVSTNGYVAFAATLAEENGGDFSNDPYLPAVPDNSPSSSARIYAYHDELSGEAAGASLKHAYFAQCPRPSGIVPNEACSVLRWKDWTRLGENQPIDVELVLYHASDSISVQYISIDASAGGSACTGVQSANAADGGAWSCNGTRAISAGSAICFFDPAHLPATVQDHVFSDGFEVSTP
ncbi:MAG: hypothetical protein ABI411_08445 [Tahibacter sp.]